MFQSHDHGFCDLLPALPASCLAVPDASPALDTTTMPSKTPAGAQRHLTETDAIDIWIARWLRVRRKDLLARYACDPRRLYEVWEESRFPSARKKAIELFSQRYPNLIDRIDYGRHQRVSRTVHPDQLGLFK
jgi:hypothetical protein